MLKDFNETFDFELRNPEYATQYLQESMKDGPAAFRLALKDVARANGFTNVARRAALNRVSMHRSLSEKGNPGFETTRAILAAAGLEIQVVPKKAA